MQKLTQKILHEEAEKYFQKLPAKYDLGFDEEYFADMTIRVFPEYPGWERTKGKIPLYEGSKSAGWLMQESIYATQRLISYLIQNNYPQEAILAILPRDFSLRISKRLNE